MIKLEVGDKVYVSKADGADPSGWAVFNGKGFKAPCGMIYQVRFCIDIAESHANEARSWLENYHCMIEQGTADGTLQREG